MIRKIFDIEGPLITVLEKAGQLIILSVLWLLCSIPVITMIPACAALYYSAVKTVRAGRGRCAKEFFSSLRSNLKRGIPASLVLLVPAAVLLFNVSLLRQSAPESALLPASYLLLLVLAMTAVYTGPVLSRFSLKTADALKLSFVMSIRFIPITLCVLACGVLLTLLQLFILPMPFVLLLPGLCCFALSFLLEKTLRFYMPPAEEGEDVWYFFERS